MKYLFPFLILIVAIYSCQQGDSNAQQNKVKLFADYYVRYLQSEQQLKAEATFKKGLNKEGAKKIELEGDIRVLKKSLTPIKLKDMIFRYQLEEKTVFKDAIDFVLEHDKGDKTTHAIKLSPIGKFSLSDGKASKTEGFELLWDGADLLPNERMLVLITDQNSKAHSITIDGPSSNQRATIEGTNLQPLSTGNGYIYLVKKKSQKETKDGINISSLAEFYTNRILIDIVE